MRPITVSACLIVAGLASGQAVTSPNAVRLSKYILGVADLDRSYAFYHALGMEFENANASLGKPNVLPEMLLKLVDVPAGTKFRNMMLKIPKTAFALEVTEFSGMELHPVKPRVQDPGASQMTLSVDNLGAALAAAKKNGGVVVSKGGVPVAGDPPEAMVRDPDGYYVWFTQSSGTATGNGKITDTALVTSVVQDSEKASAFYRDRFGFTLNTFGWTADDSPITGTPGLKSRMAIIRIPTDKNQNWSFVEFKGADRKPYTARIPDPGAPAIGLQVRDIDAAIAAVKAAGGSSITQGGSLKLGSGKVGFVRDPSGMLVELAQP